MLGVRMCIQADKRKFCKKFCMCCNSSLAKILKILARPLSSQIDCILAKIGGLLSPEYSRQGSLAVIAL